MIEVWARRENSPAAAAFVEELNKVGQAARENNSQWFDANQIDKNVAAVYHDGTDPVIAWTYEQHGVQVELIPGFEPRHVTGADADAEDAAARAEAERQKFALDVIAKGETTDPAAMAEAALAAEDPFQQKPDTTPLPAAGTPGEPVRPAGEPLQPSDGTLAEATAGEGVTLPPFDGTQERTAEGTEPPAGEQA